VVISGKNRKKNIVYKMANWNGSATAGVMVGTIM